MSKKEESMKDSKVIEFPVGDEKELKEEQCSCDECSCEEGMDMETLVTRGEFIEIMSQVVENVNQMADYLMKDVNTMYSQHVFPFQMRATALEEVLIEKGIVTYDEVTEKVNKRIELLQKQAKEIKEKEAEE